MSETFTAAATQRGGVALRLLLRVFLTLFAALCGFAAGAALSSAVLISSHAGLAGAAEAVFYGGVGAIVAGAGAGFIVFRLGSRTLLLASGAAAIVLVFLLARALWSQGPTEEAAPAASQPRPVTEPAPVVLPQ